MEARMSKVVAVIVTWRRERELERLLASLEKSSIPLHGCVVMDHAGTLPEEFAGRSFPVRIVQDVSNPGPGAGWANGSRIAREFFGTSDFWYLDDDVVIPPDTLEILLREKGGGHSDLPTARRQRRKIVGISRAGGETAKNANPSGGNAC